MYCLSAAHDNHKVPLGGFFHMTSKIARAARRRHSCSRQPFFIPAGSLPKIRLTQPQANWRRNTAWYGRALGLYATYWLFPSRSAVCESIACAAASDAPGNGSDLLPDLALMASKPQALGQFLGCHLIRPASTTGTGQFKTRQGWLAAITEPNTGTPLHFNLAPALAVSLLDSCLQFCAPAAPLPPVSSD